MPHDLLGCNSFTPNGMMPLLQALTHAECNVMSDPMWPRAVRLGLAAQQLGGTQRPVTLAASGTSWHSHFHYGRAVRTSSLIVARVV
jgi:hypothetical protein